jgi:hypothetical protein
MQATKVIRQERKRMRQVRISHLMLLKEDQPPTKKNIETSGHLRDHRAMMGVKARWVTHTRKRKQSVNVPNLMLVSQLTISPGRKTLHKLKHLDILAIAVEESRLISYEPPRQPVMMFQISDRTSDSERTSVFIQHYENAPSVEKGDYVWLRNFIVHCAEDKFSLYSGKDSFWCVSRQDSSGPSVKLEEAARKQIGALIAWEST